MGVNPISEWSGVGVNPISECENRELSAPAVSKFSSHKTLVNSEITRAQRGKWGANIDPCRLDV